MAEFEKLIPHIIKWEAGADPTAKSSSVSRQKWINEIKQVYDRAKASGGWNTDLTRDLFIIARARGYANDPSDSGGHTCVGVTLATYESYCKKKGIAKPTVEQLKNIPFDHWREILKTMFWDRFKADQIQSQSIANLCVDWLWGSGTYAIKNTQQCLKLVNDGIVGSKTLGALNSDDHSSVFKKIWKKRRDYYYGIVARKSSQQKFLRGWLNRLNDCKYED